MPKLRIRFNHNKHQYRLVLGTSVDDIAQDAWKLQVLGQKVLGCKRTNQVRVSYKNQDLTLAPINNVHYTRLGPDNLPRVAAYSLESKLAWLRLQDAAKTTTSTTTATTATTATTTTTTSTTSTTSATIIDLVLWQYSHDECMLARMKTARHDELLDCYFVMHKRHKNNADIFLAGFKRDPELIVFMPNALLRNQQVCRAIAEHFIRFDVVHWSDKHPHQMNKISNQASMIGLVVMIGMVVGAMAHRVYQDYQTGSLTWYEPQNQTSLTSLTSLTDMTNMTNMTDTNDLKQKLLLLVFGCWCAILLSRFRFNNATTQQRNMIA